MDMFLLTSGVITLVLGTVFFRRARNITNWIKKNPKNHQKNISLLKKGNA
jgi:hypothetical protein